MKKEIIDTIHYGNCKIYFNCPICNEKTYVWTDIGFSSTFNRIEQCKVCNNKFIINGDKLFTDEKYVHILDLLKIKDR